MTQQTDTGYVHLFACTEKSHARERVFSEILRCRIQQTPLRSPNPTVVKAQYSQPVPREMIGQNKERSMSHEGLISILCAGARDEN